MKTDHTLTASRLRELVRYEDGNLYWRNPGRRHARGPLGTPAGRSGNRLQVHIDRRAYYVHRLVWLYHHGVWPDDQLDHINGDGHDNRIENLRQCDTALNLQNRRPSRGGVTYEARQNARKWRARIMVNGRSISLGYYATRAEAEAEYNRAKLTYHPFWVTGMAQAS